MPHENEATASFQGVLRSTYSETNPNFEGNRPKGHEHLIAATAMLREMDMRFWLERAEAELKALP